MEYTIRDIFIAKNNPITKTDKEFVNSVLEAFNKINQEHEYISSKLGKNWIYEEKSILKNENFPCPNNCKSKKLFYTDYIYYSKNNSSRIIQYRCFFCKTGFLTYQEKMENNE